MIDFRDFADAGLQLLRSAWRRKLAVLAIFGLCLLPLLRSVPEPPPPEYVTGTELVFGNDFASAKLMDDLSNRLANEAWLKNATASPAGDRTARPIAPNTVSQILRTLHVNPGQQGHSLMLECRSAEPHDGIAAIHRVLDALSERQHVVQQAQWAKYGLPSIQQLTEELERQVQSRTELTRQIVEKRRQLLFAIRRPDHRETEADESKPAVGRGLPVDASVDERLGQIRSFLFLHVMLQGVPAGSDAGLQGAVLGNIEKYDPFLWQLALEIGWLDSQIADATGRIGEIQSQRQMMQVMLQDGAFTIPRFEMSQGPTAKLVSRSNVSSSTRWAIFGGLGLLLAGGFVFVADIFDDRFRSPEEVARLLDVPVLCTLRGKPIRSRLAFRKTPDPAQLHVTDDESIRTLDLALTMNDGEQRVILCTAVRGSATPVAMALAASGVRRGQQVLLVDADFRCCAATHAMAAAVGDGLGTVLRDRRGTAAAVEGRLRQLEDGLTMLAAEEGEDSPLERLASPRMHRLLQWAEGAYDRTYVVLPPAFLHDDAALAASSGRNVILVVEPHSDLRREALEATARLESFGGSLCGIVTVGTNHFAGWHRRCYRRGLSGGSVSASDVVPEMADDGTIGEDSLSPWNFVASIPRHANVEEQTAVGSELKCS